ncbi:muscarinic acetylcholine receptor M3-like [Strongylocentrotus purpuratus]|uniref:G-protein coupled receptors family 1 profile domain-containing protein n=1 Tax=Strongylocentrotus purpuratus TaxID=7668 RepID=A0A7M7RBP6_STRPU|nr:muscarinic acetylcholine receptor M3-like [Strongylocentrotus purpuratus]|eukprot:XP_786529.1 PREDICTED: muscarinic acetylcholine receptor M3-like [Strongylocentrotus purpuratus]
MSFEDYFANSTEDLSETTITEQKSRSVNIHGILWPFLYTVLIIVANFLSLIAFFIEKRLRAYNNYFIINLTILDFLTGLFLIPTVVHTHIGYYPFSQDICKVISGLRLGILNASNLAVVVICADRHQATYDPINHFISRNKRMAVIKNIIPWIVSVVFWFLYTTIPEFIIDFDNDRHCIRWYTLRTLPGIIPFIALFYLPFTIIAVLYFRIVAKIQATLGGKNVEKRFAMKDAKKGKITAELPHDDMTSAVSTATINIDLSSDNFDQQIMRKNVNAANNAKKTTINRETATEMSKATRTLLFIVVAFVVSWLPQSIMILIYSIEPVLIIPGLPRPARLFIGWMPFLNSLLNPIAYAVSQPLFRSTIFNMFLCRRRM